MFLFWVMLIVCIYLCFISFPFLKLRELELGARKNCREVVSFHDKGKVSQNLSKENIVLLHSYPPLSSSVSGDPLAIKEKQV